MTICPFYNENPLSSWYIFIFNGEGRLCAFQARYEYSITPRRSESEHKQDIKFRCLILKVVQLYDSNIWWKMWSATEFFVTISHPQTSWSILAWKGRGDGHDFAFFSPPGKDAFSEVPLSRQMLCASPELQAVAWSALHLSPQGAGERSTEQSGPSGLTQGVFCSPLYMQHKTAKEHS